LVDLAEFNILIDKLEGLNEGEKESIKAYKYPAQPPQ
jgi:hypothetical protein